MYINIPKSEIHIPLSFRRKRRLDPSKRRLLFIASYTQRILDLGLRIAESIDNQHIPQSAIPNPKSHEYIKMSWNALGH